MSRACVLLLALNLGICAATATGATTVLEPAHVAREFVQRSWLKKDGLPDNQVQALLQTRDGYLWIGTRRGLARFDGLKFAVFDHLNTPELPDDNCKSLAEDLEGNLWIATDDGLVRCRDGTFKRFTKEDGLAHHEGLVQDKLGPVYADRLGRVWITPHARVDLLENGTITHCRGEDGQLDRVVFVLHHDSAGVLWTGGQYLHRFNERTRKFEIEPETHRLGLTVAGIQDDGAGRLWLLCIKSPGAGWLYRLREVAWNGLLNNSPVVSETLS